jgi:hypothetical protein
MFNEKEMIVVMEISARNLSPFILQGQGVPAVARDATP